MQHAPSRPLLARRARAADGAAAAGAARRAAKAVLAKNCRLLRRDKPALRREVGITVLYFGFLVVLHYTLPSTNEPPPRHPGESVLPLLPSNLSHALQTYLIRPDRNRVLVAPCDDDNNLVNAGDDTEDAVARVRAYLAALPSGRAPDPDRPPWPPAPNWLDFSCAPSAQAIKDMATDNATSSTLFAAVEFTDPRRNMAAFTVWTSRAVRAVRMSSPATARNYTASGGIPDYQTPHDWFDYGLVALQHAVQKAVIDTSNTATATTSVPRHVNFRAEPYIAYDGGVSSFSVANIVPMIYIIIAIITSQAWVKQVVEEKEKGLRERLLVSGFSLKSLTLTWGVTFALKSLTYIVASTFVSFLLLKKTSVVIFAVLCLLFCGSIVSLVLLVSTCFKTAKTAVAIFTFGAMIPGIVAQYLTTFPRGLKLLLGLFSPVTFVYSFSDMFAADAYNRQGYNWGNLMTAVGDTSYGQSVGAGMLMLALDTVLYAALAVYLNFVLPGNGGRTRPCCFCVRRAATAPTSARTSSSSTENGTAADVERAEANLAVGVSINGLRKEFTSADGTAVKAVDGLSLDMYDGQVTALLGHNGAGKTTTMSLLTGSLDVDGGDADIYGRSLSFDIDQIRRMCGICTRE